MTRRRPRRALLGEGNTKLGPLVHTFSLQTGATCPGKTPACAAVCYAARGYFCMPANQRKFAYNLRATRRRDFVARVVDELDRREVRILRIHVAGDFYSAAYARRWLQIAQRRPGVVFLAYTRSWRIPEIRRVLRTLGKLPNVRLWYSTDVDSGPAPKDARIRHAFMARNDTELLQTPSRTHLAFRDHPRTVRKKIHGIQICPVENGVETQRPITCSSCQLCFAAKYLRGGRNQRQLRGDRAPSADRLPELSLPSDVHRPARARQRSRGRRRGTRARS